MQDKLTKLKEKQFEWLERMDITVDTTESRPEEGADDMNPEDDFKREMLL